MKTEPTRTSKPKTKSKQKSPAAKKLERLAKEIAKAKKPNALHAPLFGLFGVVAAAGDVPRAKRVLDWMYGGRTPAPSNVANALSTQAMDCFCAAAELGDVTKGLPYFGAPRPEVPPLAERVRQAEAMIRERVLTDAFAGEPPTTDAWREKDPADRMTWIERWRRIQAIARQQTAAAEEDALGRLDAYLTDLAARGQRFVAFGAELALAVDLAHRRGGESRVPAWLAEHGHLFVEESFLLETAMCFPSVAAAIVRGELHDALRVSAEELDAALAAVDATLDVVLAPKKAPQDAKVPKVQKRRVSCSYSQVHLEPESPTAEETARVHFQRPSDSKSGMSLFETTVAIATPSDTDYVDVEVTVSTASKPDASLDGVAQAVAFPLVVRGPLRLTSVDSAHDEEPVFVPPGTYDVLARFFPKKAPRAAAEAGLRVFKLDLAFHAKGSLGAPQTLRLEA